MGHARSRDLGGGGGSPGRPGTPTRPAPLPQHHRPNPFEVEASRAATGALRALTGAGPVPGIELRTPGLSIQRVCAECASGGEACEECAQHPPPAAASARTEKTGAKSLIVDDDVETLGAGQLRKSQFLAQLKQAVCTAADEELVRAGRSTSGCPHIAHWFGLLEQRDAAFLERGLRKFAPEAREADNAVGYVAPIVARVRSAVVVWVDTGRIVGIPTDLTELMSDGEPVSAGDTPVQRKGLDGAETSSASNPAAVRSSLGAGRALDAGVRSRMESAFSADFSRVRVHADARAGKLSSSLSAKAFTVGDHVAFKGGEYRPGTMLGDALIAHELAHVVQQGATTQRGARGQSGYQSLEHDADRSTLGAMLTLWRGSKGGLGRLSRELMPKLRSGVQLQRCSDRKICPKGKEWAVMPAPAGVGPVCICRWHCVYSSTPPYVDSSGVARDTISCTPPCRPPPPPEVVGDDFVQEEKGKEDPTGTSVGAHFTPMTSAPSCGCIRPDNLVGPGPQFTPLMASGLEVTDLFPRAGQALFKGKTSEPPPVEHSRAVIEGPAVAGQPVRSKPVQVAPVKPTGGPPFPAPVVAPPVPAVKPAGVPPVVKVPAAPVKPVVPTVTPQTPPPAAPKPAPSLATDPAARTVWGTRRSKIFHEEGSGHYDQMKQEKFPSEKGRLMTAAEAEAAGYRPAKTGGNLEAARRGTAEHAMIKEAMRPDEGKLHGEGWRLVKVERTVGGTKRVDELWVNDGKKRVFVADTYTGKVEPPEHYQKGWAYANEPEIKALIDQGYTYDYSVAIKHPEKLH